MAFLTFLTSLFRKKKKRVERKGSLEIRVSPSQIRDFEAAVMPRLGEGWSRAVEKEERGRKNNPDFKDELFYFECIAKPGRESCIVALDRADKESLHVLTLFPLQKDALTPGEFNVVLKDFHGTVLLPLQETFASELDVEDYDPEKHSPPGLFDKEWGFAAHRMSSPRVWW